MKDITYIYSYYDNAGMLLRQLGEWESYPESFKKKLSVIITDDCSSKSPVTNLIPAFKQSSIDLTVFRITKKVPWNWLACRNIGARHAKTEWLLLTDMDHMIAFLEARELDLFITNRYSPRDLVYLFTRQLAPDKAYKKPHDDSFLMTKKLFWKIGGYDEEFSGNYGTSGAYRRRAFDSAAGHLRLNIPLTLFSREVLADASTTEFVRKHPSNGKKLNRIRAKKLQQGRLDEIRVFTFPYSLVYSSKIVGEV